MAELKTFLFTDICRSVELKNEMAGRSVTERDRAFIETILTPHRQRIEAHLEEHGGRVVSTAGDGHFLVFDNTVRAAQWAVDVQRDHRDEPIETPGDGHVEVRVSIHVGVPQVDPADPYNFVGKSVDYASRLNDYAQGSQILVSRSVMSILHDVGLDGIAFHLHGRRHLKGIGHVEVHELLYDTSQAIQLRQQPASQSDREWTVLPTEGFDEISGRSPLSDTALATTHSLKRIGNYELEKRLGSGGMGDVYKGRHSQFDRVRAIKVIKPQYVAAGNEDVIRRFYREIKAVGVLEHKNIVVAIDSSAPDDRLHYLVMEYIDGVALNDLVEQLGHLSIPDACEVARQAARGLQYIHRHGMVHRDIKPSNLMLTLMDGDGMATDASRIHDTEGVQGVVKILDLGLALLSEDQHERVTRFDNKAMGTGMYMSPEQWKTTSVDIRADIYSLGCTLYHLLAGQPPFVDSDLRPEKAHEKSRLPPIRTGNPIPRKLWEVLSKMLAKNPGERYTSPADVATALLPFAEGQDLATLVQNYAEPESRASHLRHTRSDSGARIDTWLSRASYLYPTRRWVLRRGLPLLAIAAVVGLFFVMLQQSKQRAILDAERQARDNLVMLQESKQQAILNAERQARDNLPTFAKIAAEQHIGAQIAKRFEILQRAAQSPELITLIENFDVSQDRENLAEDALQDWIKFRRVDNHARANSDSWFINDLAGIQIARSPITDEETDKIVKSFLKPYAYRNYFHGLGKDLPTDQAEQAAPIEKPNLSAVYQSSNSGKFKVAFSVPIWSQASKAAPASGVKAPTVIGVLSMSVDLGEFEVLNREIQVGKEFVLVDLRNDYVEVDPANPDQNLERRGMVLHHPLQSLWKDEKSPPRVAPEVLVAMGSAEEGLSGFIRDYHDPLLRDSKDFYWGAFEPVRYEEIEPVTEESFFRLTGWVLLVQTKAIQ